MEEILYLRYHPLLGVSSWQTRLAIFFVKILDTS